MMVCWSVNGFKWRTFTLIDDKDKFMSRDVKKNIDGETMTERGCLMILIIDKMSACQGRAD